MGYYILGIIIFLLMIVFISDLIRQGHDKDDVDDFDPDEYFNRLSSQYPRTFNYKEEISEENLGNEVVNDPEHIIATPMFENVEHPSLDDANQPLQDVLPEDLDREKK